jgi:hypothetical protein
MPGLNLQGMIAVLSTDGSELLKRSYDLEEPTVFVCIQPLADGGFVVGGINYLFDSSIPVIMRTDAEGNVLWWHYFSGSSGVVRYILLSPSGDLVAVITPEYDEPILACYNLEGELVWQVDYAGILPGGEGCFCRNAATGYALCSGTMAAGLDFSGGVEWTCAPPGQYSRTLRSISQTMDGGLILAGSVHQFTQYEPPYESHPYDGWLIKTDGLGTTEWWLDRELDIETHYYCARQLAQGGYAVCGRTSGMAYLLVLAPELGIGEGLPPSLSASVAPNPFSSATSIAIRATDGCVVEVTVFDLSGRVVDRLPSFVAEQGTNLLDWTPDEGLPGGLYLFRVEADGSTATAQAVRVAS